MPSISDPAACLTPARAIKPRARIAREDRLHVRVVPSEMTRWRTIAKAAGLPLSTWLRGLADEAAATGRDPTAWRKDCQHLLRTLNSGVGNDLNQLTKLLHTERKAGHQSDLGGAEQALAAMTRDVTAMRGMLTTLLRRET